MITNFPPYPAYKPSTVAWLGDLRNIVNPASVKTGYEISFTRYFYQPQPLRPPHHIWADIHALEQETEGPLGEIMGGSA